MPDLRPRLTTASLLGALACLLFTPPGHGADDPEFPASGGGLSGGGALNTSAIQSVLPADEAFPLTALVRAPDTIVLMWDIQDGYYLYRKSLSFTATGSGRSLGEEAVIPAGEQTEDEFFGAVEVYYDRLLVEIPFPDTQPSENQTLSIDVTYQGCAEAGYCYPMTRKTVSLEVP